MPADADDDGTLRGELERLLLAAVGAVALTGERADALAAELAERGELRRDEARATIDAFVRRWRAEPSRLSGRAGAALEGMFRELGLVPRRELEELELRLAQLEHRLRLVEGSAPPPPPPPPQPPLAPVDPV